MIMPEKLSTLSRRSVMAASAAAAAGLLSARATIAAEEDTEAHAIRPFSFHAPEAKLTELRRRINATQWPERETVNDDSQGVQLATTQKLARYWATEYDWRRCE